MFTISVLNAQHYFKTDQKTFCYYNDKSGEFDDCSSEMLNSTYVVNETETEITHTIPTMQSVYYINEKKFDGEMGIAYYYVTSDAGNDYIFAFDVPKNEIRVAGMDKKTQAIYLITYRIYKSWQD